MLCNLSIYDITNQEVIYHQRWPRMGRILLFVVATCFFKDFLFHTDTKFSTSCACCDICAIICECALCNFEDHNEKLN